MRSRKRERKRVAGLYAYLILLVVTGFSGQAVAQDCNIAFGNTVYDVDENEPSNFVVIGDAEITEAYTGAATGPGTPDAFILSSVNPGPDTLFNVNSINGEVTIGSTVPNFEVDGPSHTVYIICTTDSGNDGTYSITVNINDINDEPVFRNLPTTISIPEDIVVGTTIYTVNYYDEDGDAITVDISGQDPSTPGFANTDQYVTAPADLDYDAYPTKRSFALTISLNDGSVSPTSTLTVNLIDVNDESPIFGLAAYTGDIDEALNAGSTINWANDPAGDATDADAGDILTYTISGVNSDHFICDLMSGIIVTSRELEADGGSAILSYSLTMTVTDNAGNVGTTALTISVNQVNDHSPIWNPSSYTATTAENTVPDTQIAVVTVTDDDDGADGVLTVTIASGDDVGAEKFTVDGSGPYTIKTTTNRIDYEDATLIANGHLYRLIVEAVDGGATPITSTATVVVTITSLNEYAPSYTAFPAGPVTMSESEAAGFEIASTTAIEATDAMLDLMGKSLIP
ncbi:cadherin EGF LAG seven-pass G-type receptor 2-like [Ptychodera flava]|uniref:cadherin EGF LAG seven-pass G-type receptor 2-like n=1 Tax=Ptychodera flava TaxID=63121 RepID=UPI00396A0E9C